jgi:hypothetical protein
MKITITYRFDGANYPNPFWAESYLKGHGTIYTCGCSWYDARQRHLQKLKTIAEEPLTRSPETIEI